MKAKEYLEQIKLLDCKINAKLEECDALMAMATKVTASVGDERVQASGSQQRMADTVAKIVDLKHEINNDIDRLVNMKANIMQVIDTINNPDYVSILYKRYYQYKTWEQISVEMHCTYQWVCVLHGRALNVMDSILKGNETVDRN